MTARHWPLRVKLNLVGALILLSVLVGWLIAYDIAQRLAVNAQRVAETEAVVRSIRQLDEYRTTNGAFLDELGRLRTLSADNPRRLRHLDALERLLAFGDTLSAQPITVEMRTILVAMEREESQSFAGQIGEARVRLRLITRLLFANETLTFLILLAATFQFNRDLTRRHRLDRELREAKAAADAANLAKTQFLATVSHEIRTPLNAISGMSEVLLDTPLEPEQAEFVRSVQSNADALGLLLSDLLDSSKIEAGQLDLQPEPFDLRELVEGVAEILIVRAEPKGVELIVDLPLDGPWQLIGDRHRLRQVLMNLVGNAVKFTDQGEVIVRVSVTPSDDRRSATVITRVIDTGIGIAPEAQGRIFERFVQADRSTVTRFGGTGLGLNISRSLLGLMGGRISVESALGRGSTFTFEVTLPVAVAQSQAEIDRTSLAGVEIVVVEANGAQRSAIARLIEYAGAVVHAVAASAEALAGINDRTRLVIVGENLDGMSTLDFAHMVASQRTDGRGGALPLVLLCSLRSMMTSHIGTDGIRACVYKPVKQGRLMDAVRAAVGLEVTPAIGGVPPTRSPGDPALGRVLLVEDHRDNWILATRMLVSAGLDVDLAQDGLDAVARASAVRYDLILMDIELPKIDGLEAARRIRAREQESGQPAVPIVAVTAHAMENFRKEALAAGMNDYITKPFEGKSMRALCARYIIRRPAPLVVDDDIADLLPGYVSARREDIMTLRALLAARDMDGIRRIGHKMKGSGGGYGMPLVSEAGRQLDQAAAAADAEAVQQAIAYLDESLSRLRIRSADGRVIVEP